MNYAAEFEAMLKEGYIDYELYRELEAYSIGNRIKSLIHELRCLSDQQKNVISRILNVMTELNCYKMALNAEISYSTSIGEDGAKYISARSALSIKFTNEKKSRRVVSNYYLGDIDKFIREDGRINVQLVKHLGSGPVIEKLVAKLLDQYGH